MRDLDAIIKAYDVRGTYPDQLDEDLAREVGAAFVRVVRAATRDGGPGAVVVARDMRPSGPSLVAAFADGVREQGCDVILIGLASTDGLYFASGRLDLPGAMFTASHNPARYNGIKLCRAGAAPVGEETGLRQIKAAVADGLLERGEEQGRAEQLDLLPEFVAHVRSFVDLDALAPLRVVADTANGVGGLVVPADRKSVV